MAYRYGDRFQLGLFPPSIEDYVTPNDPVRAYDAFVEALDFNTLGIEMDPNQVGNPAYDPKAMLKLFVYGYSYGVKSARKLEREVYHNLSFIWLMGGLKPDHKTISEFRRKNKGALKKVLRQCARMCLRLELIAGNVLFVDGTKIRANASRGQTHDQAYYEQLLSEIDGLIEQLVEECEKIDETEQAQSSWVEMEEELAQKKRLKDRVESETSDLNQFAWQIDQANEVLDKPCEVGCSDAGYADTEELQKVDGKQIKVVVPSQRQALHEEEGPFTKSHFRYDKEQDCYWCPQGHRLNYVGTDKGSGKRHYQIIHREICQRCVHYGQCTEAKKGRKIIRLDLEEVKERLEAQYEEAPSQEIYAKRKARVEHPFGHIKRNLKTDGFLLRC